MRIAAELFGPEPGPPRSTVAPVTGPVLDGVEVRFRRVGRGAGVEGSEQDRKRPGQMRRIGRVYLRRWGLPELVDTACLLLSELVTNARAP